MERLKKKYNKSGDDSIGGNFTSFAPARGTKKELNPSVNTADIIAIHIYICIYTYIGI